MKKAIVLGGTEDHIKLLEILKKKSFYTILIDYYENPPAKKYAKEHICESTLDKEKILGIAKSVQPEMVVSTCIDQALLTMAYVCEKLNLPCHISYQTALELTNKTYMKEIFFKNDIPSSNYIVLEKGMFLNEVLLKFPVVVKPADSNSSKGITRVNNEDILESAVNNAYTFSRTQKILIEEFVDGDEFSVDVAVKNFEPVVVLITKNIKLRQNKNTFTIVQSLFPATKDDLIVEKIKKISKKIASAFKIKNGPLLIQMIVKDADISVIEFSSRIGGGSKHHFIQSMTGFDLMDWFVNLLNGDVSDANCTPQYKYGSVNYIYAKNGMINGFAGFEDLKHDGIIENYFLYKNIGMKIENHICSADRPAGYIVLDNNLDDFYRKCRESDNLIRIIDDSGNDIMFHNMKI